MSILSDQKDVIDAIEFHLAMSDTSRHHPDGVCGGITLENMLRGYLNFFKEELERYGDREVSQYDLELSLREGGRAMLKYLIGDHRANHFINEVLYGLHDKTEKYNEIQKRRQDSL